MSITYFVPLFTVDHLGMSEKAAATTITLYFLGGLWENRSADIWPTAWERFS